MRNHIQPSTRTALFRKVSAGVGLTTALVVMWALPASASTVKIGPQATQGSIKIKPGDWISAGYVFRIPGVHPAEAVGFGNAVVVIPISCSLSGAPASAITVVLTGSVYVVGSNDHAQYPSGSTSSTATFEGSVKAPNLCSGGPMYSGAHSPSPVGGGIFSADLQATAKNPIAVAFHYRDPNAKGFGNINCAAAGHSSTACGATLSAVKAFSPVVTTTPAPTGSVGGLGLTVVAGGGFLLLQRRYRRRANASSQG